MSLFIGIMSGTSMDGIDVAVTDFRGKRPRLLAAGGHPWPDSLVTELRALAAGRPVSAARMAQLDVLIAEQFAGAVNNVLRESGVDRADVTAIGCHGQTVAHLPDHTPPATLQLGDANTVAELTAITTVNDFRRRDMAAGGQGAPLAPAFHAAWLADAMENRAVLNLGGIANLTLLPAAEGGSQPTGFDTGPANCLLDLWHRRHRSGPFDAQGAWAASSDPNRPLLQQLLSDPYFASRPPKSTGTQYFSAAWLDSHLDRVPALEPAEIQATLSALTAESIASALEAWMPSAQRLLVCGGGVRNTHLLAQLATRTGLPVESTERFGLPPEWMEAMAFAWLAAQMFYEAPANLPSVTGATGPRLLGAIHPA